MYENDLFNVLYRFLGNEYLLIAAFAVFVAVVDTDKSLRRQGKLRLLLFGVLCVVHALLKFLDYNIGMEIIPVNLQLRFFCANTGYMIRPVILILATSAFTQKQIKNKLYYIPVTANTVIYFLNIFTNFCFVINEENHHHSTYWNYTCFIVSTFYFIVLIIETLKQPYFSKAGLKVIACVNLSIIAVAALSEMLGDVNVLDLAILVSTILHYVIFFVCRSNDQLRSKDEKLKAQKNALMISQIQPHFIYNTLNAIYYLCQTDAEQASDTVLQFSDYLRENLVFASTQEQVIPIEDEIRHVRHYTDIEKLRFPKLTIDYQIDDYDYMLPPLSIQPLVENAIRHGVRGKNDGRVCIRAYRDKDAHIIEIDDNGIGIKDVSDVFTRKNEPEQDYGTVNLNEKHTGMGIINVSERIKSISKGDLKIDSSEGCGTKITIKIPIKPVS